jgi:hypothetical protein
VVVIATFVSADGLHMNDWSYACLAKGLALAIAEAATRPTATATGRRWGGRGDAVSRWKCGDLLEYTAQHE